MPNDPMTTPDYRRGVEAAARACDRRAASYLARADEFRSRGMDDNLCDMIRMKAETAESIARTIRAMIQEPTDA